MARYLDPKNDLTFKRIFGEHPDLLKSFLNALMPLAPGQLIERVDYLLPEQVPDNPAKKNSIVDVRCEDNYGRQFIVEMQMYWTSAFSNRMVFNASKAYVRQLKSGEDFNLLQPVYGLAIINSIFDHKTPEFYHHYQTVNRKNTDEVIRGLEFVLVELPKFRPEKWVDRKMAVLWLRFLKEVDDGNHHVPEELLTNADISKALDLCERGAFTDVELDAYDRYWDAVSVEKSLLNESYTEGWAEGRTEGEAIGMKKGRTEGEAIGLEKGRAEGSAAELRKVVLNGQRSGLSIEQIQAITGLSKDEIAAILHAATD
jgi:predicted transposase/invertase (TIGR01784 family)